MLDGQAPDIEVVTDCNNDIHDERAVDTDGAAQHQEHVGDLIDTVAQGAGPAEPRVSGLILQEGTEGVDDSVGQRENEYVGVGVVELH